MQHKAGIYVRVSTEEQANVIEGSIEIQQHRIREFVKSKNSQMGGHWAKIVDTYIDDGYSAKDTKRPQYQRMIGDIRSGRINLILVTEISRLSRNTFDFSSLLRELDQYRAKFLSVKEQFDTSTPAGEMMVNFMATLAQFERKQTSERVTLNFHSRAMRGLRNGSRIILGYDPVEGNPGKYAVNKEEAAIVRRIFDLYLENGNLRATTERLNTLGISPKKAQYRLKHWTMETTHTLLTNMAYIGVREVNKGNKNEDQSILQPWQKYQVVDASWPAIVKKEVFDLVQAMLNENRLRDRERRSQQETRSFLLSGILKCKECGRALLGKSAHGKWGVHRYYDHKDTPGVPITCEIRRVRADELEDAVFNHLSEIVLQAGYLDDVEENIRESMCLDLSDFSHRKENIARQVSEVERQIDDLLDFQLSAAKTNGSAELIQEKLDKLAAKKKALTREQEEIVAAQVQHNSVASAKAYIKDRVESLKRGWRKANPVMKKRLLRQVIEVAYFRSEALEVRYITDKALAGLVRHSQTKKPSEGLSEGSSKISKLHQKQLPTPSGNLAVSLLPSVEFGGNPRLVKNQQVATIISIG